MVAILTNDEIRVLARQRKKPAGVINKDYAIEWLLYGIYHKESKIRDSMIFKGGTSIRKIFFPETWRFSEDLDFTILPNTDPEIITSGFAEVCDILEAESGIKYEDKINVPISGKAILGFVQFTGPIGWKNKIKIDASRIERMADSVATQTVTTSYADLEDFTVNGYTLNEVVAEKIRSAMQRSKVRDYYDIWKMFGKDSRYHFDTALIGDMVKQKCIINKIEYNPSKIFDSNRFDGLEENWKKGLKELVVEELPEPDTVFNDVKNILEFLPRK